VHAARAAYLAGCTGTSCVEAGFRFGIPVSGTMAHSWIMAFEDEMEAFRTYAALYGDHCVLLIDTYDVMHAAQAVAVSGLRPSSLRLDSGDVVTESREIRRLLDRAGLSATGIFVSGDLDEHKIAAMLERGAPVTGFGVGTALSTSKDAPALGGVYKLVEIDRDHQHVPTLKRSIGKASYPGRKQVWRTMTESRASGDVLGLADEPGPASGAALMEHVMTNGQRLAPSPPLEELRTRCLARVASLPADVRRIDAPAHYPVRVSEDLQRMTDELNRP
jgi:nicotinate phosphoribosyltransferase